MILDKITWNDYESVGGVQLGMHSQSNECSYKSDISNVVYR